MPLSLNAPPFWPFHQPFIPDRKYEAIATATAYWGASMGRAPSDWVSDPRDAAEQPEEEHPWWNIVLEQSE